MYDSICNTTVENKNFEFYKFLDSKSGGFAYEEVRDEIGKDLEFSDITATDLQDEMIGPIIFEEYRKGVSRRLKNDKYKDLLACYTNSTFPDFKSYIRTEVDLVEDC